METKSLVINGIEYAKYEIEGETIFLKLLQKDVSEDFIIAIIAMVEKKNFSLASYLNV